MGKGVWWSWVRLGKRTEVDDEDIWVRTLYGVGLG